MWLLFEFYLSTDIDNIKSRPSSDNIGYRLFGALLL